MRGEVNGGAFNPRNLGLYSYAWNNPVVLQDPDGVAVGENRLVRIGKGLLGAGYGALKTIVPGGFLAPQPGGTLANDSDFLGGQAASEATVGAAEVVVGGTIAGGGVLAEVPSLGTSTVVVGAGVAVAAEGVADIKAAGNTLAMANKAADAERARNVAKGIPESQLGPSGKPKVHSVDMPNRKAAEDAAKSAGSGTPMKHPNDEGQSPHFHPTDGNGKKTPGPHYNYPPRSAYPKR